MTTEQKLPEWWDEFGNAVKTRTLDQYECRANHWPESEPWRSMNEMAGTLYRDPYPWQFRKLARTVRIEINGEFVDLVAPVLAGDVVPKQTPVCPISTTHEAVNPNRLFSDTLVFITKSDRDAMRAALLGVKP